MPVSDINNLTSIAKTIEGIQPKSVLDLGIGFGKYGVICREILDVAHGRVQKEQWKTFIRGVEGFEQYRNPCWSVYSEVNIMDFSKTDDYPHRGYDLVLMIDSLEHLDKSTGAELLTLLMLHNRYVLVSVPTGDYYLEQGAANGNEYECHRAHWTPRDLVDLGGKELYRGICTVQLLKGWM